MFTSQTGITIADSEELTKHHIRQKVWKHMMDNNIARYPLPVFNRIPNFQGCGQCGNKLAQLPEFISAPTVKVNPDKPQEEVRFWTLALRKKLLVPSPRLISGLFNLLENTSTDDANSLRKKSQAEGVKHLSVPISLEDKISVDLIVIGSVAVSQTGRRIGKGEGFADLEYAMMKTMNAINNNVLVVTTVHDCQVFDDLPSKLFQEYDVPIDIIVTPTTVIQIDHSLEKPKGIYWHLLTREKFNQIPILKTLYEMDKAKDIDVTLMDGYHPSSDEGNHDDNQHEVDSPRERDFYPNSRRGQGRFMRNRGGRDHVQEHNYNQNASREFVRMPFRSRGRGRGRGWNRRLVDEEAMTSEEKYEDKTNLQVTINVDKKNHIVRRAVEETNQFDRVGDASQCEDETPCSSVANVGNDFAIYVGGIPKICRFTDLRTELYKRNVKPNYIAWKMNGFAFLNFYQSKIAPDEVLESLRGLSLKQRELKLDIAPINKYESGTRPERQSYRPQREEAGVQNITPGGENVKVPDVQNGNTDPDDNRFSSSEPLQEKSPRKTQKNRPSNDDVRTDSKYSVRDPECEQNERLNQTPKTFKPEIVKVEVKSKIDNRRLDQSPKACKPEVVNAEVKKEIDNERLDQSPKACKPKGVNVKSEKEIDNASEDTSQTVSNDVNLTDSGDDEGWRVGDDVKLTSNEEGWGVGNVNNEVKSNNW